MQKHNFKFVRGDDVSYRLLFRNKEGEPVDLSGIRCDLHVVAEENGEPVIRLHSDGGGIEITENGTVQLNFAHADTQSAEWESARYDLQLTDPLGKRKTVLYGTVQLIPDQTRV